MPIRPVSPRPIRVESSRRPEFRMDDAKATSTSTSPIPGKAKTDSDYCMRWDDCEPQDC